MTLVAAGVSHRTARIALREGLALGEREAAQLLGTLVRDGIEEAGVLSTCQRTELYLVARDADAARRAALGALARAGGLGAGELEPSLRMVCDAAAAEHLFRVTAGLDSVVVGEAEIQGQVRRAYALGLSLGTGGRIVNRLFQDALRTGKRVRAETAVGRRRMSVASVAVGLAQRELGSLAGRRALVIGTGRHGALAAAALVDAGVRTLFLANRGLDRATALAQRFESTAVPFDQLEAEMARCDLVLCCTACPHRVLHRDQLAAAVRGRRLVIIDTAVPRDVDPAAAGLPGVTLLDLDAIEGEIARNRTAREAEALGAQPIIDAEVAAFARHLAALEVAPTIAALHERGRVTVERVLRENEPRWRSLTDDDRRRVEFLARAIVRDLLREPTIRLRRAGERGSPAGYAETVRELFGITA